MELEVIKETERETAEALRKKTLTRAELMEKASAVIALLHGRTTAKAFRERQDDPIRLQYARATVQAVAAYGALLKDAELDEIRERLDAIEAKKTCGCHP